MLSRHSNTIGVLSPTRLSEPQKTRRLRLIALGLRRDGEPVQCYPKGCVLHANTWRLVITAARFSRNAIQPVVLEPRPL